MKLPINKFLTQLGEQKPANLLILSIGNPSPKFDGTRHSAGHMALDYVAKYLGGLGPVYFQDSAVKMAPLIEHPNVFLAKSQEYMNLSGKAVRSAVKRLSDCKLVVVHDDIDCDVGQCKFKLESRQVGGHGGLKDIVKFYPEPFARMRIGIGCPPSRALGDVADYVLKKLTIKEREAFEQSTLPEAYVLTTKMARVMDRNRSRRSSRTG